MSGRCPQLDNRLMLCARFVRRGAKLADIGTDHAYLPVWLCRNGICPKAVAADVNPEPLERGRLTVEQAGLESVISLRLSDGLKRVEAREADDIVIAGMGGELIADIILSCGFSRDGEKRFILQPMTKSEELVRSLYENGFEILAQDCCEAAGKCYTVMSVAYTGQTFGADEPFYYLGKLNPSYPLHRRFLQGHIERLRKKAIGDKHCGEIADELEKTLNGA
ncbi:MAG TPA: SAM-dependent methyltransferase [Ruminococcaceae bacterium]|nr:SAM-dependent methyltransferase [Oscillospiraceae bacterium]